MKSKVILAGMILLFLTVAITIGGLLTGSYDLGIQTVGEILLGKSHPQSMVILDLRLPRVLLAFATGGLLTLSGFLMQAVVRNPLADPYIMGVSGGAGLGVNILMLGLAPLATWSIFTLPLFAAIGGLGSLLLVLSLGYRGIGEETSRLLIAGVAVSSFCTAIMGLLIYRFAGDSQVRGLLFWTFGSFDRAAWPGVWINAGLLLGLIFLFKLLATRLDLMMLGEESAKSLGLQVATFRLGVLLAASLAAGTAVAFCGPIGFVGLMGPHFSRAFFGGSHRTNLLPGVWLGGVFLAGADLVSRWILPPAGLPVGIVTALLGVPFFLYLLFRKTPFR